MPLPLLAATAIKAIPSLIGPITQIMRGCGETCTQASSHADQAQAGLDSLKSNYFSVPSGQRTRALQQETLREMDGILNWLHRGCSAIQAPAGQRCISERLIEGGFAPWCPTGTGCDWITVYRKPIAMDHVTADAPILGNLGDSLGLGGLLGGSGGTGNGNDSGMLALIVIIIIVASAKRG